MSYNLPWFTGGSGSVGDVLQTRPSSPHADDQEFDSSLGAWTYFDTANAVVASPGAIDPYTAFTSPNVLKADMHTGRSSHLRLQCSTDGVYGLTRAYTLPTNLAVWCRASFQSTALPSATNNDRSVGLIFTTAASGGYAATDYIAAMLNECDTNTVQCNFISEENDVLVTNIASTNDVGRVPAYEYMALHKVGATIHAWTASGNGNWHWLGSRVYAGAPLGRISLIVTNEETTNPANQICTVDFVRFMETATAFPV